MDMTRLTMEVPSSDGIHTLRGVVHLPSGEVRGFFHIVHGMTEHIARYEATLAFMAENGYIAFGYDNLGHGETAVREGDLGFIAGTAGDERLAEDVSRFSHAVRERFDGGRGLPYLLLGHSMGSFIVRLAVTKYVTPDRLILMGTAGRNPAAPVGLALARLLGLLRGERHVSRFLDRMAFGSYNKRFGGGTPEDPRPWLTSDDGVRERYYADPFCTFGFSVSAMGDLIRLIKRTNGRRILRATPREMPILLVAGTLDPVGRYGRGIGEVCDRLCAVGAEVRAVLYEGARHEILNEFCREEVLRDILDFCNE